MTVTKKKNRMVQKVFFFQETSLWNKQNFLCQSLIFDCSVLIYFLSVDLREYTLLNSRRISLHLRDYDDAMVQKGNDRKSRNPAESRLRDSISKRYLLKNSFDLFTQPTAVTRLNLQSKHAFEFSPN